MIDSPKPSAEEIADAQDILTEQAEDARHELDPYRNVGPEVS